MFAGVGGRGGSEKTSADNIASLEGWRL
jgi:hypothetical protein